MGQQVAPGDNGGLGMTHGEIGGFDWTAPELESTSIDYDETGGYQNVEMRPQGRTRPDPYLQEAGSMGGQDDSEPDTTSLAEAETDAKLRNKG